MKFYQLCPIGAPEGGTAESWDNVGLQLDTNRDFRVAVVLELNLDTWDIIKQYDYDLIISHHPLIFKPLHSVGYDDWGQIFFENLSRKMLDFMLVIRIWTGRQMAFQICCFGSMSWWLRPLKIFQVVMVKLPAFQIQFSWINWKIRCLKLPG